MIRSPIFLHPSNNPCCSLRSVAQGSMSHASVLMTIKQSHPFSKKAGALAVSALFVSLLAACGSGSREGYEYASLPPGYSNSKNQVAQNGDGQSAPDESKGQQSGNQAGANQQLAVTPSVQESSKLSEEELAKIRKEALELAVNNYRASFPTVTDPNKQEELKMVVVGLDDATLLKAAPEIKEKYVSLYGDTVYDYYRSTCPIENGQDKSAVYRCVAGLYYGKTAEGEVCYTSIKLDGEIRHVSGNKVVTAFTNNQPLEFVRADVGGNMALVFNSRKSYTVKNEVVGQRVVFRMQSDKDNIEIFQQNTDKEPATGDEMNSTCVIKVRNPAATADSGTSSGGTAQPVQPAGDTSNNGQNGR